MGNKLKAISKISVALALFGAAIPAVEAAPTAMAAKKATKKAKKSTKKVAKKSTKKAKKAKKTTKKVAKKTAAKKPANKSVKKTTKKSVKKAVKKPAAKKPVTKTVKKAAAKKAAAKKAAAKKAATDKAAADKATADKAAADKAAADKAAANKAAASSNSESATVDSSSSSETTNPTVDTPFAGKAVHTIYTGFDAYLYTTKELTTIATTPLQSNTSVIAYPDGITTALTGKNAGDLAIPVTYKGQNLYFKGTFKGTFEDLASNDLYPDGYYYALGDTTFYGVVKPTDPSVKLDAPFLNGSTWFYYFDGGSTIYNYQNNVWTSTTFLNAQ